jgi:hypothetical protein
MLLRATPRLCKRQDRLTRTVDLFVAGKVDEKATQLHAIASLKVLLEATKPQNGAAAMANHAGGSAGGSTSTAQIDMGGSSSRGQQETELAGAADQPNGVIGQEEGADPVSRPPAAHLGFSISLYISCYFFSLLCLFSCIILFRWPLFVPNNCGCCGFWFLFYIELAAGAASLTGASVTFLACSLASWRAFVKTAF